MGEAAIFIYGLVVFTLVATACGLILYGIVTEQRDRRQLDADADAAGAGRTDAITRPSGDTVAVEDAARGRRQ